MGVHERTLVDQKERRDTSFVGNLKLGHLMFMPLGCRLARWNTRCRINEVQIVIYKKKTKVLE